MYEFLIIILIMWLNPFFYLIFLFWKLGPRKHLYMYLSGSPPKTRDFKSLLHFSFLVAALPFLVSSIPDSVGRSNALWWLYLWQDRMIWFWKFWLSGISNQCRVLFCDIKLWFKNDFLLYGLYLFVCILIVYIFWEVFYLSGVLLNQFTCDSNCVYWLYIWLNFLEITNF